MWRCHCQGEHRQGRAPGLRLELSSDSESEAVQPLSWVWWGSAGFLLFNCLTLAIDSGLPSSVLFWAHHLAGRWNSGHLVLQGGGPIRPPGVWTQLGGWDSRSPLSAPTHGGLLCLPLDSGCGHWTRGGTQTGQKVQEMQREGRSTEHLARASQTC